MGIFPESVAILDLAGGGLVFTNQTYLKMRTKCSAWKDFGLQNKNWVPSPAKIGLSVVFKEGRWGLIEE